MIVSGLDEAPVVSVDHTVPDDGREHRTTDGFCPCLPSVRETRVAGLVTERHLTHHRLDGEWCCEGCRL